MHDHRCVLLGTTSSRVRSNKLCRYKVPRDCYSRSDFTFWGIATTEQDANDHEAVAFAELMWSSPNLPMKVSRSSFAQMLYLGLDGGINE
jgi:hypothetical protein